MSVPRSPSAPARPSWRRPVLQFVAVGLVTAGVLAVVTGWFSRQAAWDEALQDAQATTRLLGRSVVEPAIPPGLLTGDPAAIDRFDELIEPRVRRGAVLRVKLWDGDGTIVWSDESRLNGRTFDLEDEEVDLLRDGGIVAGPTDLSRAENVYDQELGDVVEVYTRVFADDRVPLLFEVYFSASRVTERADEVVSAFRPIPVGAILLFLGLTVPLVWVLARRLDAAASDREELLLAAVLASDVERRRIARDLHDGVVQDLAGTAFALSASSRAAQSRPDLPERLEDLAAGVRQSLRQLRSLLVEIYPPDLYTAGLAAALDDLVAPAAAAGVDVRLEVEDTSAASDETVGLLWRVAQEAVRNAMLHSGAGTVTVRVTGDADAGGPGSGAGVVVLDVVDDGVGFDPEDAARTAPGSQHFGLRSLRDLVAVAGGDLRIRSAPGAGTHVQLEVSAR